MCMRWLIKQNKTTLYPYTLGDSRGLKNNNQDRRKKGLGKTDSEGQPGPEQAFDQDRWQADQVHRHHRDDGHEGGSQR